jgi:Clr5 domain
LLLLTKTLAICPQQHLPHRVYLATILPASAAMIPSSALETGPPQQQPQSFGATAGQDFPRNSRQYNISEWRSKRPLIKHLYIDLNTPLDQVMTIMSQEHNFHATYVPRDSILKHIIIQANTLKGAKCTKPILASGVLQRITPRRG